jgi:hypothetical protein
VTPLTDPGHQLRGLLEPTPEYDTLLLALPATSYVRGLWGHRVAHREPVPPVHLITDLPAAHLIAAAAERTTA